MPFCRSSIMQGRSSRRAYTLIEFLVVVAILAVVLGIIFPAIQSARESARRAQCHKNVKELALACLNHELMQGRFPTGGWGVAWTGDADLGFGQSQPGGWLYNIWPYLESQSLYGMGEGLAPGPKNAAHLQRLGTGWISFYYCPTRRKSCTYPWINSWSIVNAGLPKMVDRNDYAANGGDVYTSPGATSPPLWTSALPGDQAGPVSLAEGGVKGSKTQVANAKATFTAIDKAANGVIFCGSMIKMADIADGTGNTYLLGEKCLNPDAYATGEDPGDNAAALVGDNENVARWTFLPPLQDTPGYAARWRYGSAHPSGFSMAFCDGSAKLMDFTVDPRVHRSMGNRKDRQSGAGATP
jgi:prepilin-type N-terminal cleavage/methylation domain-containing protein